MTNPTEAAIRERAQESHAYALMVLGDMFNALHLQAAELERVTAALRDIADHCVVSEGEFPDDNCDWHCTAEIVATAKAALAGAARAAQEGDV
jgi:hypothetical protein